VSEFPIPALPWNIPIVDPKTGRPTPGFQRIWNNLRGTATTAQETAETAADGVTEVATLTSSGVTPNPLSASDAGANASVSIANHTRVYGDGTTVSVIGGSVTALAYSTLYYVYYDQPSRAGGSVSYAVTTNEASAAQVGDRHLVGTVTTPAAAAPDTDGEYVRSPGVGGIIP
jgi:hypothetical protein